MMNLFARGGSLSALALALAATLPATPVMAQDGPNARVEARAQARADRQQVRSEVRSGRGEARLERSAPQQRQAPQERSAPQQRQAPQVRSAPVAQAPVRAAPAQRGFGGDVARQAAQASRAQQVDRRSEGRADRIDRRSEGRAAQIDRRSEVRADRVERRGDFRSDQLDRRGRDGAADRVDRRTDVRADRIERRGDFRSDRVENRGDRRADRVERQGDFRSDRVDGRRDGVRDGRGGGFTDQVRGVARDARRADGRRDDVRRGEWRGDRGRYNGSDFRRWDRGWRSNRVYNYNDYRRANRFAYRPGPYYAPYRSHRYNRLQSGFFLDSLFFQPRFFLNDPYAYRLPPAYGPYRWVRYYDDVILVDIYSGEVVDVIHDFFW
jgi:hypothetical protein